MGEVKGLCLHHFPTPNTHTNPAVSHGADGPQSPLSEKVFSCTLPRPYAAHKHHSLTIWWYCTESLENDDMQPMVSSFRETHLAYIHTNHMAGLNHWWEAHRHTNLFVNFKLGAGQRDHTMTSSLSIKHAFSEQSVWPPKNRLPQWQCTVLHYTYNSTVLLSGRDLRQYFSM